MTGKAISDNVSWMAKTIVVCGVGRGISMAVAERFGNEGFSVALVARNAERLAGAVTTLESKGIRVAGFPTDLGSPAAVKQLFASARNTLGPVTVLHWNAYAGAVGDLLEADAAAIRNVFELPVVGFLNVVKEALPDLRQAKDAAVLVTNGGLGLADPQADAAAVQWNAMGLAAANAAKHKVVRLLHEKLKSAGIFVGEVMVLALVKGTAFDNGSATLAPATVADQFWQSYQARNQVSVMVG